MKKIIIAFFFGTAFLAAIITAVTLATQYRIVKNEIAATGVVTEVLVPHTRNRGNSYNLEFKTMDGQSIAFRDSNNSGVYLDYSRGDSVPACYVPANPQEARLWQHCGKLDWIKILNGFGLTLAAMAMGFGASWYFKKEKTKNG